jgi:hypothetical protein
MKEKLEFVLYVVIIVVALVVLTLYGIKWYTAPCAEFKQFPLSGGYAPARCVV